MQRFVSAIGFSPHLVTRPIIASGISRGDRVEIIRPDQPDSTSDERTQNAIDDVRMTLSGAISDVTVEVVTASDTDFNTLVDQCSELYLENPSPTVCFGAGSTDLQFPMLVAAIAHCEYLAGTTFHSDLRDAARPIELPALTTTIPGRTRETFRSIADANEGVSLADLARDTDASRSTVTRHVLTLEDRNLVTTHTNKKEKIASPTVLGRLLARNITH